MLKLLGLTLRILHRQLNSDLAVEGLVDCLNKLVVILVGGKEGKLLGPVSLAVGYNCLPLDIPAAEQTFKELVEVPSTLAQISNNLEFEFLKVVE